jgi:hypothetical protein
LSFFNSFTGDFDLSKRICFNWLLGWVFLQFCRNWSRLTLKKLWWDVKSISAYLIFFRFVGSPEALNIENVHMKVKNWSCPIYQYGTFSYCKLLGDSKNVRSNSTTGGLIRSKYMKFSNFANFWSFWPVSFKVDLQTTKLLYFWNQFAIRKSTILIYRATSIFDIHMNIFNIQGLRAPVKPKKKIKYAEIDFTSHHSFLRLRKVKKINLKLPHTKRTQPIDYSGFFR